jgi:deoxyribodipyrimidine photo-lyase
MTVALLWFRRNLRLSDNSALLGALDRAETVVPVFDHSQNSGPQGPGAASISWLNGSLASLDLQLRERGSALTLRTGMPSAALAALAEETGACSVHC